MKPFFEEGISDAQLGSRNPGGFGSAMFDDFSKWSAPKLMRNFEKSF